MSLLTTDIRPAIPIDAPALAAVHAASWQEAYAGILPPRTLLRFIARRDLGWWVRSVRGAGTLVLEADGRVVGYSTVGRNRTGALPQGGEVYELYLLPPYQGVGLGRRLFEAARARLRSAGLDGGRPGAVVWSIEDNERAMRFYEALGGRDVAEGTERFEGRVLNKVAFAFD